MFFSIPSYLEHSCSTIICSGHTALERVAELCDDAQIKHPMLLCDKNILHNGMFDVLTRNFSTNRIKPGVVFSDIPPDSSLETIQKAAALFREHNCDGFIACGGGSVIDSAKAVNILITENSLDLQRFAGSDNLSHPLKSLIAIPTTAGTGSEVTGIAVIADKKNKKKLIFSSPKLQPFAAVIDPRMSKSLSGYHTATTAFDALSHAIEALISRGKNPISDVMAIKAISVITENLCKVLKNPANLDGRLAIAQAATLAGIAFSNSMVGMCHAIGHALGAFYGISHGQCITILLPYALEYNSRLIMNETAAELTKAISGTNINIQKPPPANAETAAQALRDFSIKAKLEIDGKLPLSIQELNDPNIKKEDFPLIARQSVKDPSMLFNPVDLTAENVIRILNLAWDGQSLK